MNKVDCLTIHMSEETLSLWNYLLQKGFALNAQAGMSVRDFFHQVLKYDDDFIESNVRTVFMNFSPVDNIDEVHLKDGDKMALGSAMPGLVGIVMGRDNPFKSFRSDISAQDDLAEDGGESIHISLKIFSSLAVETGRDVLRRGIEIDAAVLAEFLTDKADMIRTSNSPNTTELLSGLREIEGYVSIRVEFE